MPSTYNGIGTHYYGKKNIIQRTGECSHCGRQTALTSYDTRLWFVVIFVPIIPLGRKRIVDQCSSCTYHFALDADKWETAKQLQISGAEEQLRANPTPENAIAVHRELVKFHQFDEAAAFRRKAVAQFPASAQLQSEFAEALAHFGKTAEAATHFERALALRPDLPAARIGVAYNRMDEGRLDEARRLLDFLESPGAAQLYSLSPLEDLALAYQKADRHDDALALFAKLQEALPQISNHKGFRSMVQKSEKALGRKTSQLPKRQVGWRDRFSWFTRSRQPGSASPARLALVLGAILAIAGLGFAIANEYIRRNRTLHIVNSHSKPARVEIVGIGGPRTVARHESLVLPEGKYRAVVSGPVAEETEFEVRSDYFSRWFDDPAWILNVGGDAILVRSSVVYRSNPPPARVDILFGNRFEFVPEVTHPFIPLPESLQMKSGESRTLVDLQFYDGTAENLLGYLADRDRPGRALDFAESWLRTHPDDESILNQYLDTARRLKASARAGAYLEKSLAARPVRTAWHRAYQILHENAADHAGLLARYDAFLAAAPQDSALLYLRGRIDSSPAVARGYFERSLQADPDNPFPLYGIAYAHLCAGDWADARPLLERGGELRPDDPRYGQSLVQVRIALGETTAVVAEATGRFWREPGNPLHAFRLVQALAANGGDAAELRKICDAFEQAHSGPDKSEYRSVEAAIRRHTLYLLGDFASLAKAASGKTPAERTQRAQALLEQGQLDEAAKSLPPASDDDDLVVESLVLSAAYRQAGNAAESDRWLARARQSLESGDEDSAQAAAWLADAPPRDASAAKAVTVPPRLKAALLVAVIARHPELRGQLAPLAARLNIDRSFPYRFVERFTAAEP